MVIATSRDRVHSLSAEEGRSVTEGRDDEGQSRQKFYTPWTEWLSSLPFYDIVLLSCDLPSILTKDCSVTRNGSDKSPGDESHALAVTVHHLRED